VDDVGARLEQNRPIGISAAVHALDALDAGKGFF